MNSSSRNITNITPPNIHHTEPTLHRASHRTLAQLRRNKHPILNSYLNEIDADKHPSPLCPTPCKIETPTTPHILNCTKFNKKLTIVDLWTNPVDVGSLSWRRKSLA